MSGSALIGYTGFVGGTLHRTAAFDTLINSKNAGELRGRNFDLVVCAGVSAVKWLANKEPEEDCARIASLTDVLGTISAKEFVLISTIDVYPDPSAPVDEDLIIDPSTNHAYGRHRLELERWAVKHFATTRVVRLPALFGAGLKKNVLFDLLNGNMTAAINPATSFQWYPLRRLASDLDRVREANIRLINLFPEPIWTSDIVQAFFHDTIVGPEKTPAPCYGVRTKHSKLFGGPPGYVSDRITILGEVADFVAQERRRR